MSFHCPSTPPSLASHQKGPQQVKFTSDGATVWWTWPPLRIRGLLYGGRYTDYIGHVEFHDEHNDLQSAPLLPPFPPSSPSPFTPACLDLCFCLMMCALPVCDTTPTIAIFSVVAQPPPPPPFSVAARYRAQSSSVVLPAGRRPRMLDFCCLFCCLDDIVLRLALSALGHTARCRMSCLPDSSGRCCPLSLWKTRAEGEGDRLSWGEGGGAEGAGVVIPTAFDQL